MTRTLADTIAAAAAVLAIAGTIPASHLAEQALEPRVAHNPHAWLQAAAADTRAPKLAQEPPQ